MLLGTKLDNRFGSHGFHSFTANLLNLKRSTNLGAISIIQIDEHLFPKRSRNFLKYPASSSFFQKILRPSERWKFWVKGLTPTPSSPGSTPETTSFLWRLQPVARSFPVPVEHCYPDFYLQWLSFWLLECPQKCRKNRQGKKGESVNRAVFKTVKICFPIEVAACRMMTPIKDSDCETHHGSVEHCETVASFANSAHTISAHGCRSLPVPGDSKWNKRTQKGCMKFWPIWPCGQNAIYL